MQFSDQLQIDTPEQITLELPLAGIGSRFLGLAVDTLLQFVLYMIAVFLFTVVGAGLAATGAARGIAGYLSWIPAAWIPAILVVFMFCIYWGYFTFFEIIWKGQTPGKRVAKIRVIKDSGRPINAYEAIGRNLLRAIDGLPGMYGVGIICMMISRQHRRLGDYVAGTVVVHDRPVQEARLEFAQASAVQERFPSGQVPPDSASGGITTNPQLTQIAPEELLLIESFLQRRHELDVAVRDRTAFQIATRITAKTGLQREPNQSLDDFLESVARQVRDTARFR